MKFVRKELLAIPVEKLKKWPDKKDRKHYNFAGVAALQEKDGETFLVFTIYSKDKKPYMRLFFAADGVWKNYMFGTGKWDSKELSKIYIDGDRWDSLTGYRGCISDEKTDAICCDFMQYKRPRSAIDALSSRQYRMVADKDQAKQLLKQEKYAKAFSTVIAEEMPKCVTDYFADKHAGRHMLVWNRKVKMPAELGGPQVIQEGYCTACKTTQQIDAFGTTDKYICAECGKEVTVIGAGKRTKISDDGFVTLFEKQGENAVATVYRYESEMSAIKESKSPYAHWNARDWRKVWPIEQYVYTKEGNFACHRYVTSYFGYGATEYTDKWHCIDRVLHTKGYGCHTIFDMRELRGTILENSHFDAYIKMMHKRYVHVRSDGDPIKYCDLYTKYPGMENLLLNGFYAIVEEKVDGSKAATMALRLKGNCKPSDILGLNKAEQRICRAEQWNCKKLYCYKRLRTPSYTPAKAEYTILADILFEAYVHTKQDFTNCCTGDFKKGVRYIHAQNRDKKSTIARIVNLWRDYLSMSEKLGEDIEGLHRRYPKNLQREHDRVVQKTEFLESETLKAKFQKLAADFAPFAYEKDGLCIRIAKSEKELIVEGKILDHCVGGYGKSHCEGRSIFFVRRADAPDTPLYTLQVELKSKSKLQLHGYGNERDGKSIPQEVTAFISEWLQNVLLRYDVQTHTFTEKRKKTKAASAA